MHANVFTVVNGIDAVSLMPRAGDYEVRFVLQREMVSEDVLGGNCIYRYNIWMDTEHIASVRYSEILI